MKKLVIIAAVSIIAAASQGATFTWKTGSKAMSIADATVAAGLTAKTYDAASGTANADTMKDQMSAYGATWEYTLILSTLDGLTVDDPIKGNFVNGSASFSSRKIAIANLDSDLVTQSISDPTKLNYSLIIKGTITDGKGKTWNIESNDLGLDADGNKVVWTVPGSGDIGLTTANPTKWTVTGSDVPEPTSALLLLLGMAGLALRRKQA